MKTPHRILVATDLAFWRATTGAEQRILSLVQFLNASEQVRCFFLSSEPALSDRDRRRIDSHSIDVRLKCSSQMPRQWKNKLGWYASAIQHAWQSNRASNDHRESTDRPNQPLRLADFRWPWAITAFQESVEEFQPTVILIEYIKLAYLLDGLTRDQRDSIHCIVDTHDILSERCRQFRERGHAHWVEIDRREEADEISKFDLAIAIQDHEASQLREMCTGTKVITCGHFADLNQIATNPATGLTQLREPDSVLTLGCMASANAANISSLQAFVDRYWSKAVKNQTANPEARLRLVIAGNVCEHLSTSQLDPEVVASIQCIGFQEQLSPFYQTVDIVVNPIDFGTGLKIKNLEALAFGRPLLTTPHGAQGMEVFLDSKSPIRIYDSPEAFTELIKRLLDPNQLEQLCGLARTFRESGLSQKETYSQLSEFLEEHRELS